MMSQADVGNFTEKLTNYGDATGLFRNRLTGS